MAEATEKYSHDLHAIYKQLPKCPITFVYPLERVLFVCYMNGDIYQFETTKVRLFGNVNGEVHSMSVVNKDIWVLSSPAYIKEHHERNLRESGVMWRFEENGGPTHIADIQKSRKSRYLSFFNMLSWRGYPCLIKPHGKLLSFDPEGIKETIDLSTPEGNLVRLMSYCIWDEWLCVPTTRGDVNLFKDFNAKSERIHRIKGPDNAATSITSDGTYLYVMTAHGTIMKYDKSFNHTVFTRTYPVDIPTGIKKSTELKPTDQAKLIEAKRGRLCMVTSIAIEEEETEFVSIYYNRNPEFISEYMMRKVFHWRGALIVWRRMRRVNFHSGERREDQLIQYSSFSGPWQLLYPVQPKDIKDIIKATTLVYKIGKSQLGRLPLDILFLILQMLSQWTTGYEGKKSYRSSNLFQVKKPKNTVTNNPV